MKRIFTLALILFASCEDTPISPQQCLRMTFSDGLPVQLWLDNCDTFNEKESCGIHSFCFCQPFNCEDEIRIRFEGNPVHNYDLLVYSEEGNLLETIPFDIVENGIFEYIFVPCDHYVDDQKIRFVVQEISLGEWTGQTSAADNEWDGVVFGNGVFVAISRTGTGNRVMTSTDGATWTSRTSAADNLWNDVAYGNGVFVAISSDGSGSDKVMTSPDGVTWTIRTGSTASNWLGVTFGNGLFVAVAGSGTSGELIMTSPDGVNWTTRTNPDDNIWSSVAYGNGLFVAVARTGVGNRVMTSPDGTTWTARISAADNSWADVVYGNGVFVAVSDTGTNRVMTSTDGINWVLRESLDDSTTWNSITFNGIFVATGRLGDPTMISYDGIEWFEYDVPNGNFIQSVTYGNGLFVAVANTGAGNRVMTLEVEASIADVAKSDCISIKESHDCTSLIQYRNSRNFAGIDYENLNPDEYFYIRVPSVFFHERFPEESEAIELTDRIITLNGTIKAQTMLDTDYMPYYMHRKMKLILAHQQVIINDKNWTKQEQYEISDSENKRYPMRKAICWLTEKNYVQRNVL